jgi:molybdenum cofactor cytidylyltransferase
LTAVILAGGNSVRINTPKLFLPYSRRMTFIEKIVKDYYTFGCSKIILVLNKKFLEEPVIKKLSERFNIKIILNEHQELGRFYSVSLGVSEVDENSYLFIQNADNPFISNALLERMYSKRNIERYVIPVYNDKAGHPVLIGKKIIGRLKAEKNYDSNLRDILHKYKKICIPVKNEKVLANINSMSDYSKYFKNYKKDISNK